MPRGPVDPVLVDRFGRPHSYLRISLTERCNLRCTYCMPEEGHEPLAREHFMTAEDMTGIAGVLTSLGVEKIRLTGGEPLLRKDFGAIVKGLAKLDVLLTVTSNAVLLDRYLDLLDELDVRSLNISLDTLRRDRFFALAKRDDFDRVKRNLDQALNRGFRIKLNAVLLPGFNDDEAMDFIQWSAEAPLDIRFIEFMPFEGNQWHQNRVIPWTELLEQAKGRFDVIREEDAPHDTARHFRVRGGAGRFGFIASMTSPFCSTCNRLRLTAEGSLRNCLFSDDEVDLLTPWRAGEELIPHIRQSLKAKHARHAGKDMSQVKGDQVTQRSMIRIGG